MFLLSYTLSPRLSILYERLEAEIGDNAMLAEEQQQNHHPNNHRGSHSQQSQSTPSNRRVIDYSPSPEDTKTGDAASDMPTTVAATAGNGEARQGMKVTLKRNSHANGKEGSW